MHFSNKDLKSIRWGIIGCGDVTEVKSGPAYQQTEGFELAAVMRRSLEKARDYAQRHHVKKFYNDAQDLISDKDIDAVYIATPPDSHMHYALKVAAAGKPCCIEKPMAPSYKECLAIHESFNKKKLPLFVAYYRRTLPRFQKVKEMLDADQIGELRHINWILNAGPSAADLSKEQNWRTDSRVAPGGYFDDLASHGLDLFEFLLGEVKEASGFSLNQQGLYSAVDAVAASWIHKCGATGSASWNFGSFGNEDKVDIYGSSGKITFSVFQDGPLVCEKKEGREEVYIEHPQTIQLPHVQEMKRALFDDHYLHPSTGATALHTSWFMDKILGKI